MFYSSISAETFKIQTNIVAGGLGRVGAWGEEDYMNIVELNIAGEKNWKLGSPLPVALEGLRGVTVLSQFYVTGETLYSDIHKL